MWTLYTSQGRRGDVRTFWHPSPLAGRRLVLQKESRLCAGLISDLMEADITEKEFRQNETIRTRSQPQETVMCLGQRMDFRGGSILEGPRSMAQMGEFPIMTIACNGIQRDRISRIQR